jgi:hypothetical protein
MNHTNDCKKCQRWHLVWYDMTNDSYKCPMVSTRLKERHLSIGDCKYYKPDASTLDYILGVVQ